MIQTLPYSYLRRKKNQTNKEIIIALLIIIHRQFLTIQPGLKEGITIVQLITNVHEIITI